MPSDGRADAILSNVGKASLPWWSIEIGVLAVMAIIVWLTVKDTVEGFFHYRILAALIGLLAIAVLIFAFVFILSIYYMPGWAIALAAAVIASISLWFAAPARSDIPGRRRVAATVSTMPWIPNWPGAGLYPIAPGIRTYACASRRTIEIPVVYVGRTVRVDRDSGSDGPPMGTAEVTPDAPGRPPPSSQPLGDSHRTNAHYDDCKPRLLWFAAGTDKTECPG